MAIFLSYRRADSELVVGPIYDRLAAHFSGERVFRDLDSLPIGKPFPDALAEALVTARIALIVIGPTWVSTKGADGQRRLDDPADYVRLEVEKVLNAGIPVVPVLVNRASMPNADELPASLQGLVFRQGLQVRPDPDFHGDVSRLVNKLHELLGEGVIPNQQARPQPAPPTPSGRRLLRKWIFGGTAAFVLASCAFVLLFNQHGKPGGGSNAPVVDPGPASTGLMKSPTSHGGQATTTTDIPERKDSNEAKTAQPTPPMEKLDTKVIEVRISRNADRLGETLVRTLLPDAQPGATVVQSTKVSKDGKVIEVVIRVEYESRFGKQNATFAFTVTANRLEKLEPSRESRPPPSVASEANLRRAEERLQDIWRVSNP